MLICVYCSFLTDSSPDQSYRIGIYAPEGTYDWRYLQTGKKITYSDWKLLEPNGEGKQNCVAYSAASDGQWVDFDCDKFNITFICEWPRIMAWILNKHYIASPNTHKTQQQ